jgi:hypothetical protein
MGSLKDVLELARTGAEANSAFNATHASRMREIGEELISFRDEFIAAGGACQARPGDHLTQTIEFGSLPAGAPLRCSVEFEAKPKDWRFMVRENLGGPDTEFYELTLGELTRERARQVVVAALERAVRKALKIPTGNA